MNNKRYFESGGREPGPSRGVDPKLLIPTESQIEDFIETLKGPEGSGMRRGFDDHRNYHRPQDLVYRPYDRSNSDQRFRSRSRSRSRSPDMRRSPRRDRRPSPSERRDSRKRSADRLNEPDDHQRLKYNEPAVMPMNPMGFNIPQFNQGMMDPRMMPMNPIMTQQMMTQMMAMMPQMMGMINPMMMQPFLAAAAAAQKVEAKPDEEPPPPPRIKEKSPPVIDKNEWKNSSRIPTPPPPPSLSECKKASEKVPPKKKEIDIISSLLENKDVSLSSLLEAAIEPKASSKVHVQDARVRMKILDLCERQISRLYVLKMSGGAAFLPSLKKKRPHDSSLVDHHPPLDFNSSDNLSHRSIGLPGVFVLPKKPDKEPEEPQHSDSFNNTLVSNSYEVHNQWQPPQIYTTPYIQPVYQDIQNFSATDDKFVLKKILRSLDKAFYFLKENQNKSTWNVVIDALNSKSKDKKYENYIFLYGVLCFHCEDSQTLRAIVPTNDAFKFISALHYDKHDLNKEELVCFAQCYFTGVSSVCQKQNLLDVIYDDCLKCKAIRSGKYEEFMLEVKANEFIEKCKEKEKARDEDLNSRRSPHRHRVSPIRISRDKSIGDRKRSRSRHSYESSSRSRSSRKRSRSRSRSSNRSRSSKNQSRSQSTRSKSSKRSPKHKRSHEGDMDGFIVLDECNDKMDITPKKPKKENTSTSSKENNLQKPAEKTVQAKEKLNRTAQEAGASETKPNTNEAMSIQDAQEGNESFVDMDGFIILDECDENFNADSKPEGSAEMEAADSGEEKQVLDKPLKNDALDNKEPAVLVDSKSSDFRVLGTVNNQDLGSEKFSDEEIQRLEPLDHQLTCSMDTDVLDIAVSDKLPSNIDESVPDMLPDDQKVVSKNSPPNITEEETHKDTSIEVRVQPDTNQTAPFQDSELIENNEISLSIMKAYEYQNQEDMKREENFFDEIDRILVDFEKQNALDQKQVEDACAVQQTSEIEMNAVQHSDETPNKLEVHQKVEDTKADDTILDTRDVSLKSAAPKENDGDLFAEGENSNSSHSNEEINKNEKPIDFKTRIKNEQMSNSDLKAIVDRIKSNDQSTKEKYVLKKGMLCEKTSTGEVRIVTHPEGIRRFCFIVHTMAGIHAPYSNALDIFHKHFMPYNGIEAVMEEVISTCEKCLKTV